MKKLISLFLALVLVMASVFAVTVFAADDELTITSNGENAKTYKVGDEIVFFVGLNAGEKEVLNGQAHVSYDSNFLEVVEHKADSPIEGDDPSVEAYCFPKEILKSSVILNTTVKDTVYYNYSKDSGVGVINDTEQQFFRIRFKVVAPGTTDVSNVIEYMTDIDEQWIYSDSKPAEGASPVMVAKTYAASEEDGGSDEPVTPGESTVTIIDWNGATETRKVNVGDEITVISYLKVPEGKRVNSIDIWEEFNIGAQMLEVVGKVSGGNEEMFPNLKEPTANLEGNIIKANQSKPDYMTACKFETDDSILIKVTYKVVAEGNSQIKLTFIKLATVNEDDKMETQISDNAVVGTDTITGKTVFDGEAPTEAPTEVPTEAPTVVPSEIPTEATPDEQPTEAPTELPTEAPTDVAPSFDGVLIKADGKYYAVKKGDVFTYKFFLNTGEKLCSLDADTFFDTTGIALKSDVSDLEAIFPIIGDSMILNAKVEGRLKYNYSSANGKKFDNDDCVLIELQFDVLADTGVYEINTFLHTVAGADEHKYIFNDEEIDPLKRAESSLFDADGNPIPEYTGEVPGDSTPDEPGLTYTVGDVNLDGKVNNRDAVILDRYIAGWPDYDKNIALMDAADLSRDGSVNNRDAVMLDRYIAGWIGYDQYIIEVTA